MIPSLLLVYDLLNLSYCFWNSGWGRFWSIFRFIHLSLFTHFGRGRFYPFLHYSIIFSPEFNLGHWILQISTYLVSDLFRALITLLLISVTRWSEICYSWLVEVLIQNQAVYTDIRSQVPYRPLCLTTTCRKMEYHKSFDWTLKQVLLRNKKKNTHILHLYVTSSVS